MFNTNPRRNVLSFPTKTFPVLPTPEIPFHEQPTEWLVLDDYVSNGHELLYVRVMGESMIDVGIDAGDLAVVDRDDKGRNGDLVLVRTGNNHTIKVKETLLSLAGQTKPYEIVGTITFVVKNLRGAR